ncbi:MAG: DNA gyrase C-terminal beta-propeller domain-containing protein, partial [bacterium]
LTQLEREKVVQEHTEVLQLIERLRAILGSDALVRVIIKEELLALKTEYGDERRTEIVEESVELTLEDLIADEDVVITITRSGYIKRVKASTYRTQGRGGRGVIGAKSKEGDLLSQMLTTTNHAHVLVFSNRGKVYRLRAHEIPEKERTARGTSIRNLLPFTSEESVAAVFDTTSYDARKYLVIATRQGLIKKTEFSAYDSSRRDGIIALNLRPDDEVVLVRATSGTDELIMVSRAGMAICFSEADVRPMGRTTSGMIGMRLSEGDEVVSFDVVDPNGELLLVTDSGYGKRTLLERYPRQRRGGKGVMTAKLTSRRGAVCGAGVVRVGHEVFLIASDGQVIRMSVKSIARQGRGTTGVRVMRLDPGVTVAGMAPVTEE